jgi:dUTP pyrophosphatase
MSGKAGELFIKHSKLDTCMYLKIYVENTELRNKYIEAAKKHNEHMKNNEYPDSGFDIFVPEDYICISDLVTKINFGIKCSASRMTWTHPNSIRYTGYYMYPRSSLSKTQLRLANSVGIIDSGYRGNLIGAFDCLSKKGEYKVLKYDRLVQICSPDLSPIIVEIVDNEKMLGEKTLRGEGGFGSTGV